MHTVPEDVEKVLFPAGEWNSTTIVFTNEKVEHWLNGEKLLEYEYGSNDMRELISKSKFKDMPFFAKASSGRIGLQGDHGEVWYRNIRIRKL